MIKLKKDLLQYKNDEEELYIPTGELSMRFNGMIKGNETASYILNKLKSGCSKEELIDQMLKDYDVDIEVLKKDIDDLLDFLSKEGFLQ